MSSISLKFRGYCFFDTETSQKSCMGWVNMFLVLRSSQNCRILILPPQMPCDLQLTKTKIYLPNVHSMLNFRSICPLEAVLQHPLYKEPDFAVPHCRMSSRMQKSILCVFRNQLLNFILKQIQFPVLQLYSTKAPVRFQKVEFLKLLTMTKMGMKQIPQPVADLVVILVVVSTMMMMIVGRMEVATRITTAWTKQANEATIQQIPFPEL